MTSSSLVRFDAARRALVQARTIDEVKDVRDKAEALRLYMRQAGESLEMQNDVAEIKLRAERRAGEILQTMEKAPGKRTDLVPARNEVAGAQTYEEIGLSRTQAHRWQTIAAMPEERFEEHIAKTKAHNEELTTVGILRVAKDLVRAEVLEQNAALVREAAPITTLNAAYPTITMDPPWDWGDEGDVSQFGRARPQYATMPFSEVAALPVGDLAEPDAHIYLWITNRSLPKGFALLEGWGFRYVTMLTWVKPHFGMGNYFRGSTEHILFGVRGSLGLLRRDVGTHFTAPREGQHSTKPEAFYQLVETCSPGPWLEMFARRRRPGWSTWGAEV